MAVFVVGWGQSRDGASLYVSGTRVVQIYEKDMWHIMPQGCIHITSCVGNLAAILPDLKLRHTSPLQVLQAQLFLPPCFPCCFPNSWFPSLCLPLIAPPALGTSQLGSCQWFIRERHVSAGWKFLSRYRHQGLRYRQTLTFTSSSVLWNVISIVLSKEMKVAMTIGVSDSWNMRRSLHEVSFCCVLCDFGICL